MRRDRSSASTEAVITSSCPGARLSPTRTASSARRSSRASKVVAQRCRDLRIPDECILQGELDKAAAFDRLVGRWGLESYEAVAVGDDLPDLGMMRRAGVGACPSDAVSIVKDAAALHLTKPGGGGAVRELCDLILEIRRGARADKPQEVRPAQPSSDGSVVQFPGSRG